MDLFIFMLGFLAVAIGIVLAVFNLIKKRPVKKYGIAILIGLVLAIIGLFMPMKEEKITSDDNEKEVEDEEGIEEIVEIEEGDFYSDEIEIIDENISDAFKGENYNIDIEGEENNYKVSISYDAKDDRFLESIWCGLVGLDFLGGIKADSPELDKKINTYELIFFAEGSQTFSAKVDNINSSEIKKIDLVSISNEEFIITNKDVREFRENGNKEMDTEEKEKKRQSKKENLSEEDYKEMCVDVPWSEVVNSEKSYIGSYLKKEFMVRELAENIETGEIVYICGEKKGEGSYVGGTFTVSDRRDNKDRKIELYDIIYVYGEITQVSQRWSTIGPYMDVRYVDFIGKFGE